MRNLRSLPKSITFKIGIIIVTAELALLAAVGFFYVNRFSVQVDRRIAAKVQIPGKLMRAELLPFNSVNSRETISDLIGEDVIEALVVGESNRVYFSMDPDDQGQDAASILGVDAELFDTVNPKDKVIFDHRNVVSISPIFGQRGETLRMFLYIKAGMAEADAEKIDIVHLFTLGSAVIVLLTGLVVIFTFKFIVLSRITEVLKVLGHAESGDLTIRTSSAVSGDEIGILQRGVDSMVAQLEVHVNNLEQRVVERTTALEGLTGELVRKNRELEQVLYVASHDLRSPLVNVQGFAKELALSLEEVDAAFKGDGIPQAVRAKIGPILEDEVPEALGYIGKSIAKMDSLLGGLLDLSRLNRAEMKVEELQMRELVGDVVNVVKYQLKESGASVEIGELPCCRGDAKQVHQVFSNLIGNALKYLDPQREGKIRVSGEQNGDQSVYLVTDNGIGVRQEHQLKIFELFHQLDPQQKGEGMGLAIVNRIVERHGGKVWLESEPGQGSSFYVSLPAGTNHL